MSDSRKRSSGSHSRQADGGIRNKKTQKDTFSIKMQKKLVVLYVLVLLAFAGLSVRLVWITREEGTNYQKQVLAQQRYDSTTIPYRRGDIVDSQGTRLASSEKVYNLVIDAKVMLSRSQYLEPTLQALGANFDLNMSEIREYINTHPTSSWYVPLRQLTYEEISGFEAAQQDDSNIQGVWFEEEYRRIYPYNSLAADVIGFTSTDNQGSYGLEEYYNEILNGINGREYGYLNDDLALERTVKAAVDGNTIHTTIDINVQMIVEKYLNQFLEEYADKDHPGNGADNVGCIIQWVNTGEILAMASAPNYNLNDVRNPKNLLGCKKVEQITNANGYYEIRTTNTIIDEVVLAEMTEEEIYLNLNNLWKNFCITGTYEPGSTAKPFTVAAALEEGTINNNSTFECNGALEIGGYTIHCHNRYGDGVLTVEQAVARSCNVSMMKIAQQLGEDSFIEYQQLFNFGLRTNVDLAGEARTASLVYTADKMGSTDLATNSFGQNFNVTMIEMITGFSALINGGYYYEPHLVDRITNASGATVENIEPRVLKQTVSESTSELIRQYCNAVVEYGTGTTARPAGYAIGGKTGTAETIDPVTHTRSETDHVVSFIGYAPADDPQIAIYVVVDRPNVSKQGDAKFATGIVRNILTEVLPYLNIYMTEELDDEEREELEERKIAITNQYTQTPEEDALENTEGQDQEGTGEGESAAGSQNQPWKSLPVDPVTGNYVDPETGEQYDPDTGMSVDGSESVVNPNIPVNPGMGSGLQ